MAEKPVPKIKFSREIEVRHEVDVFVAGGGPAGIAAAVTAARQGSRVMMVDSQASFGGLGTAGGLTMFCCLGDGVNFVAGGIGRDVYETLRSRNGLSFNLPPHELGNVIYRVEVLKRVYDDLVAASGAGFSLCTQCIGLEMARPGVAQAAICNGKSGLFAVRAAVFVDATGDGDLCVWAGAPYEKGDASGRMQPGTLCSAWADIDWARAYAAGHGLWQQQAQLPRAFGKKVFEIEDAHLPGMLPIGPHTGGGNIGHAFGVDGTDERSLTRALVEQRRRLLDYERFYKEYLTGFEQMELVYTGALMGIRETRRILGDYVLDVEDFKKQSVFDDEIGRFCYPVDVHPTTPDTADHAKFEEEFQRLRYGPGENYGIPYRVLTPRGLDNILVAGRCVSADRSIQGSLRVMPGCLITGQAAGMAASLMSKEGKRSRDISITALQSRLRAMGAYLPNAAV